MSNKGCKGITYIFIALLLCVAPAVGISQGQAVYLGQHVDIGNVIGWSSEIAWNGGYAPPSAGSSPVIIKLPGSLEGKANYYIDPAVFGKYPGRWYKWDGGSYTSPKENTVVFNVGNLPEEPPVSVVTSVPTVTVGPIPRINAPQGSSGSTEQFPWGIVVAVAIFGVAGFGLWAAQTKPKQEHKPIVMCESTGCTNTQLLEFHGGRRLCPEHHRIIHIREREAQDKADEEARRQDYVRRQAEENAKRREEERREAARKAEEYATKHAEYIAKQRADEYAKRIADDARKRELEELAKKQWAERDKEIKQEKARKITEQLIRENEIADAKRREEERAEEKRKQERRTQIPRHIRDLVLVRSKGKCEHPYCKVKHVEHLTLEFHHKDGDHNNHTVDNIMMLCPNHHSLYDAIAKAERQRRGFK